MPVKTKTAEGNPLNEILQNEASHEANPYVKTKHRPESTTSFSLEGFERGAALGFPRDDVPPRIKRFIAEFRFKARIMICHHAAFTPKYREGSRYPLPRLPQQLPARSA